MVTVVGMNAREALVRIRDLHRPTEFFDGTVGCEVCSREEDAAYTRGFPCETRRLCDEVLSPGEYITADSWPSVLPGTPTA